VSLIFVAHFGSPVCGAEGDPLRDAQRWLLRGRYEEAAEAFANLDADQPVAAAIGLARSRLATGQIEQADAVLADALAQHGDDARLSAERALLALRRGLHDAALEHAKAALAKQPDQLAARWVTTELDRLHGRIDQAADGYRWFVEYQRQHRDLSPEQALWIGRAAAQHARWNRDSRQFQQLVTGLYPDSLRRDPDFWPAHYEMGLLLLEKYNEPDARAELQAALAINPNAAEVHAALARLALQSFDLDAADAAIRRALDINGQLLEAHQLKADRLLAELRVSEALDALETARKLNPLDEETLGRLAAVYGVLDGWQSSDESSRWPQLRSEATARNAHCGAFFAALADSLDLMRRYPQAADFYREAIKRLPRLMYARGRLGMILMRLGEEAEAQRLLEVSFADDPFNVRVKNMLEVLEVLQDYAVLETDHFVLRYDREQNEILAEFAARYLEEQIYPEIVARLGYEPPDKSLIQIFSRARNSSGHAWFSARMVGLPFIGTVAACAGRVVAIASPTELPVKFNWARVLRHEFVHVVNLQQTDFQIPHWYTEALAVLLEDQRRPDQWTEILSRRAHAGELFDLDTINRGFIRPRNPDEWTLAYCQAQLYAEFIQAKFGPQGLLDLLDAYTDRLTTRQAIPRCFGIEQEEFERRYIEYLQPIVGDTPAERPAAPHSFSELLRAVDRDPDDAGLAAELAEAFLQRRDNVQARKYAVQALRIQPSQQRAAYVLARLYLSIGDTRQALKMLESTISENAPQENALALLAGLRLQSGDFAEAERLYRLGAARFPRDANWLKSLTRVFLKSGEQRKLGAALAELAERDAENPLLYKKLLELSLADADYEQAERWARVGLEIDVMDVQFHAGLAQALEQLGRVDEAEEARRIADRLSPAASGGR
jgi:cellulose synthase operon protein C